MLRGLYTISSAWTRFITAVHGHRFSNWRSEIVRLWLTHAQRDATRATITFTIQVNMKFSEFQLEFQDVTWWKFVFISSHAFLFSGTSLTRSNFLKVILRNGSESKRRKRRPLSTTEVEIRRSDCSQTLSKDAMKRSVSRDSIGRWEIEKLTNG
jgi:hypothetical protein